jgi:bacterioferritin-associated ferredoxin
VAIGKEKTKEHEVNDRSRDIGEFAPGADDELIICRCEEITKGEIRRAVHDGMFTVAEIRRFLRAGMGLCQGQTCGRLVKGIVARELGAPSAQIGPAGARAPTRPVEMRILARDREDAQEGAAEGAAEGAEGAA